MRSAGLKILFALHRFPPNFLGGADIYTLGIAQEMLRRGSSVSVACIDNLHDSSTCANSIRYQDDQYEGLHVRRFSFNWRQMSDPYGYLYGINPIIEREFVQYLTFIQPNIVHVTCFGDITPAIILSAKSLGVPVVLTLTGKWLICPIGTLLKRDGSICAGRQSGMTCLACMFGQTKTYRLLMQLPEKLRQEIIAIAVNFPKLTKPIGSVNFIQAIERRNRIFSEVLFQVDQILSPSWCHIDLYSKSAVLSKERIQYSPHGHQIVRASNGITKTDSKVIRFGYTGQIFSHKGVHTLISAFNRLPAGTKAQLIIFGDPLKGGNYGKKILQMAKGNPGISFPGGFDPNTIGFVLSNIDVLVVPSECVENAPLTIAEAFIAKTPVIGSDTCGVKEHIQDNINGLTFHRGDPDDLARQMMRILSEADLLDRLKAGIPPVRSVEDEVSSLLEVYQKLIKRPEISN